MFLAAFIATLTFAAPAFAVDLKTNITQLDGKPLIGADGKETPFPVATALENSLLFTTERTPSDVKAKRFQIATKIAIVMTSNASDKEITFTPQELTEIETALWENQTTLVAGQTIRIIDPSSVQK
jgi:hypothetical protein